SEKALIQILTEPKNALVRQYQHLFSMENCQLEFTMPALRKLAQKAMARDTGARALRGVMEELMLNLMYDLPDKKNEGAKYVVDDLAVENFARLEDLRMVKKESA
ncbi:MAG: ATP-dependent Clp protease ATP-binding subunit ClpX, partial [Blastochloris sp.]|nr:ATP-dependent Clp protease ATP-binding subunit ClpX [Blastochloris sp.]